MEINDYMQERQRRTTRAIIHAEIMMNNCNPEGEWVGYGKWEEAPLPYFFLYKPYFLELITKLNAFDIIPVLKTSYNGDGIDLDYIEGLILYYVENGVLIKGGPIVADDTNGILRFYDQDTTAQELTDKGTSEDRIIDQDCQIEARFKLIRDWIERQRARSTYIEVLKTSESEAQGGSQVSQGAFASSLIAPFLLGDKSIDRCDSVALRLGLKVGGILNLTSGPCRINALAYGLKESHKAGGDEEALRLALAARYGVDYSRGFNRNHHPDSANPRINKKWEGFASDAMAEARSWVPTSNQ
jgi:hypothetical protein